MEIEKEPELPKEDQITKLELDKYIRQQPNKRFLGTNLPIWIYSQSDTAKNNGWNRFKRRLGAAPVLLDSAQTALSAGGMKIYMDSKGFLDSEVIPTVDTADRKAQVTYHARQGEPFRSSSATPRIRCCTPATFSTRTCWTTNGRGSRIS